MDENIDMLRKLEAVQQPAPPPGAQMQRMVSVDTVLIKYAKMHLELESANEDNIRQRRLLVALEAKLASAAQEIEKLKNDLALIQETDENQQSALTPAEKANAAGAPLL